eukprot:scaffold25478_cov101-Isochrysis_galbana.AAC.5
MATLSNVLRLPAAPCVGCEQQVGDESKDRLCRLQAARRQVKEGGRRRPTACSRRSRAACRWHERADAAPEHAALWVYSNEHVTAAPNLTRPPPSDPSPIIRGTPRGRGALGLGARRARRER